MAQPGSTNSFHYWFIFVKVVSAYRSARTSSAPSVVSCPSARPTSIDEFNHVTDVPDPRHVNRLWGTLPNGAVFEITIAVELLPASVREWRS